MTAGRDAGEPSPPLWGRADSGESPSGEGGGSETLPDEGAHLTPTLDARQPPSALGLRPSRSSPTRGEGEGASPPVRKAQRIAAKRLRRELTPAERKLWHALRAHRFQDLHIRRQVPMGRYIADFICHANRVVIEVDGEQHGFDREATRDRVRDAWFALQGYQVLRFWNAQVLHEMESVLDTIYARVFQNAQPAGPSADAPSPPLWGRADSGESPSGEGGGSETLPDEGARLTPPLDARQPPSALGRSLSSGRPKAGPVGPSRSSPTRGEGERGA